MAWVDTTGLDNAEVLVALYNEARVSGFATGDEPEKLSLEEAMLELARYPGVDFLHCRGIKVHRFEESGFEGAFYDRLKGEGAAQRIVDELRASKK